MDDINFFFEKKKQENLVCDFNLIKQGLNELFYLIGLDNIKNNVILNLKFLLTQKCKGKSYNSPHTVIYGKPGIGKSTLAKILAKLYIGLNGDQYNENYDNGTNKEFLLNALQQSKSVRNMIKKNKKKFLEYKIEDIIYSLESIVNNLDKKNNDKIHFVTRDDLVDNVIGGTAIKTNKILEKCRGCVMVIDEAYSLCYSDSNNDFGQEALTCIIDFMDKNPNDIIIIFCGYKDKLKNTIFKVQPGLERRCQWFFEINDYTPEELFYIFKQKLENDNWQIDPKINQFILKKIKNNKKTLFKYNGSSIDKFVNICKMLHSNKFFLIDESDNFINKEIIINAIKKMKYDF